MKRRKFLQSTSLASIPIFLGGTAMTAVGRNRLFDVIGDDTDRVLVLVQLQGGNDGLTTVIPMDQYSNLTQVRNNVLVPENAALSITDTLSLHPSMTNLQNVWNEGQLGIIQGVAYPDQNRSHFRSTDIWHTASEPDEFLTTGWMGRYFDLNYSDYPEAYPNDDNPDPFALSIGTIISETCQGTVSNFSLAVNDPFNPGSVNIGEESDTPDNCYGNQLSFIRDIARQTNAYSDSIQSAANRGNNISNKYPDDNPLAQKLKHVARLISGGLKTRIYVVQLGGFDLHSSQVEAGDATQGIQTRLLGQLSDAICAFQEDCIALNIHDRVMGMTYSEFGRRIRSNESFGTDHGTAAPILVFGSCVNPSIIGDNPEIDPQVDIQEGVPMQYDFRSVYASLLMDWFQVSEEDVREILFKDFQHLPIVACAPVSTDNPTVNLSSNLSVNVMPNPFGNYFDISLMSTGEHYRVSLFNALGSELKVISSQHFHKGEHHIKVPTHDIISGIYFVRVSGRSEQKTVRVVKG